MTTAPQFRIDVDIHNLLMHSSPAPMRPLEPKGMTLPEPVFGNILKNSLILDWLLRRTTETGPGRRSIAKYAAGSFLTFGRG